MKFSIITVTYNSSSTLRDTIQSVLAQTYYDIEYIIIDGFSSDNTVDVIKEYEPLFKGHMRWISEKDSGLYDAMNKGIQMATGDIIGIINSDDYYVDNDVVKNVVNYFIEKDVDTIYTDLYLVDPINTNKIIRDCRYKNFKKGLFFQGWHPPHPALFVKKEVYDRCGYFDLSYKIGADYDFMLRILEKYSISTAYLPIYTVKMRNGGTSTSSFKRIKLSQKECLQSFKKNGFKVNVLRYFLGKYTQKLHQYTFRSLFEDIKHKLK